MSDDSQRIELNNLYVITTENDSRLGTLVYTGKETFLKIIDPNESEPLQKVSLRVYHPRSTDKTPGHAVADIKRVFQALGTDAKGSIEPVRARTFNGEQRFLMMPTLFVSMDPYSAACKPLSFGINYLNTVEETPRYEYMVYGLSFARMQQKGEEAFHSCRKTGMFYLRDVTDPNEIERPIAQGQQLIYEFFKQKVERGELTPEAIAMFIRHSASSSLSFDESKLQAELFKFLADRTGFEPMFVHVGCAAEDNSSVQFTTNHFSRNEMIKKETRLCVFERSTDHARSEMNDVYFVTSPDGDTYAKIENKAVVVRRGTKHQTYQDALKAYGTQSTSVPNVLSDIESILVLSGAQDKKTVLQAVSSVRSPNKEGFLPNQALIRASTDLFGGLIVDASCRYVINHYCEVTKAYRYIGLTMALKPMLCDEQGKGAVIYKPKGEALRKGGFDDQINNLALDKPNACNLPRAFFDQKIESEELTPSQIIQFLEHYASGQLTEEERNLKDELFGHIADKTGYEPLISFVSIASLQGEENTSYIDCASVIEPVFSDIDSLQVIEPALDIADTASGPDEKLSLYEKLIKIWVALKSWVLSWFKPIKMGERETNISKSGFSLSQEVNTGQNPQAAFKEKEALMKETAKNTNEEREAAPPTNLSK